MEGDSWLMAIWYKEVMHLGGDVSWQVLRGTVPEVALHFALAPSILSVQLWLPFVRLDPAVEPSSSAVASAAHGGGHPRRAAFICSTMSTIARANGIG